MRCRSPSNSSTGCYALKINLTSEPHQDVILPDEVEGVPVRVEVVGKIRKR
jgi:hypothetical protein